MHLCLYIGSGVFSATPFPSCTCFLLFPTVKERHLPGGCQINTYKVVSVGTSTTPFTLTLKKACTMI